MTTACSVVLRGSWSTGLSIYEERDGKWQANVETSFDLSVGQGLCLLCLIRYLRMRIGSGYAFELGSWQTTSGRSFWIIGRSPFVG